MMTAILRVMLLDLLRDRGALAMAFVLPPMIYMTFAAIFSGATGDQLRLRVAILDLVGSEATGRLTDAVRGEKTFRMALRAPLSRTDLETRVRQDETDVGLILRADPASPAREGLSPLLVIGDSAKTMASPIVAGQIQRLFGERLPDAAYRRSFADIELTFVGLALPQRVRVDAIIEQIRQDAIKPVVESSNDAVAKKLGSAPLIEQINLRTTAGAGATVVYYAGAVSILVLLFSAMQGAMLLIDERQNGIFDRLVSGVGGIATVLGDKFLFLLLQGVIQVGLIFAVAAFVYQVNVSARLPEWIAITIAASAAAAGLALMLSAICRTRQQAQTLSNFLVLALSALGGEHGAAVPHAALAAGSELGDPQHLGDRGL
jgi:ABC-2 type transport system permease protein